MNPVHQFDAVFEGFADYGNVSRFTVFQRLYYGRGFMCLCHGLSFHFALPLLQPPARGMAGGNYLLDTLPYNIPFCP